MAQQVKVTATKAKKSPSLELAWSVSLTSEQALWHTSTHKHMQQELKITGTVTVSFKKSLGAKVEWARPSFLLTQFSLKTAPWEKSLGIKY